MSTDINNKTITRDEITHLCNLVRIGATDEEKDILASDLSNILGYVEQISSVKIPGGTHYVHHSTNRMRDDDFAYTTRAFTDVLLEALPRREDDYAIVHKVLNKDSETI